MPEIHSSPNALMPATRVPEPFLRAEIDSFPLASEEAFRSRLIALDPRLGDKTGKLWRACESRYAPHTGWSLDRLVASRDRGWFGDELTDDGSEIPLHSYLCKLAKSHLVPRAGVTEVEESTDLSAIDAADHYRWLTLSLPEDMLLGALGVEPAPVSVELESPLLIRRLLDLGVAEIHQHIGAGMDFQLLWVSALAAVATSEVKESELEVPSAPLGEGRYLTRWLLCAAIARSVVAEYLIQHEGDDIDTFVERSFLRSAGRWNATRRQTLDATLRALLGGADELLPEFAALRDLYAEIHPGAMMLKDSPLRNIEDAFHRCDPIAVRLDLRGRNAGERWFLREGLAFLRASYACPDCPDKRYKPFARLFWQTLRVRCLYYRAVVERPLTGGLQWFVRFYDRLGNLRNPLNPIRPQVSYRVDGAQHTIRALEFRTGLADTSIEIAEETYDFLRSWREVLREDAVPGCEPEMGVVLHFIKDRAGSPGILDKKSGSWTTGTPGAFWRGTYAEPNSGDASDVAHDRYAEYFSKQCRKARALAELIERLPSSLWVIRGLDVARDELGVPTWVHAPLFRYLRDVSARVGVRNRGIVPPLNLTAHVGEDFRHLLEGMRRIYEQVHYVLGNNGRLGHAIALGVEPKTWAESVSSVLMPCEERLWDLVWEWRLHTRYRIKPEYAPRTPAGRVEILVNEVRRLADHIYGPNSYRTDHFAEAHHVLHRLLVPPYSRVNAAEGRYDAFRSAAEKLAQGRFQTPAEVVKIISDYLGKETIFRRGQTLIDIPVRAEEIESLDAVQRALRTGIAQRGIVIEVNPSSNLLIGDLLELRNHPILRLCPPVPQPEAPPPVAIALGSDDPLTFSTDLLHEYTLMHHTARAAGYPEHVIQNWLESIRRTGMDARFTLAWRPCAEKMAEKLIADFAKYLSMPPEPKKWTSSRQ